MHPLIQTQMVHSIRATGKAFHTLPDRAPVLEKHGLPYDQDAENVVISGCMNLSTLPHILASLSRVFTQKGLDHTFLSSEWCCGNYLYRPAIKARDQKAVEECRELSREFLQANMDQVKQRGAKRAIIFCSPCYPIYKHLFPDEEIIFYPAAIEEVMGTLDCKGEIDYYAGCYRLHRKLAPAPMDLRSTRKIFSKLKGLKVDSISAPKCCYSPEGLSHMMEHIQTRFMVHICTGCYEQALKNVKKETEVLMLPELIERAMENAGCSSTME